MGRFVKMGKELQNLDEKGNEKLQTKTLKLRRMAGNSDVLKMSS
jgi:hypothetical protein